MREQIIAVLREINPDYDCEGDGVNLAEDLDSLDIIELITELEELFEITITMEEKTERNFETVDSLVEMVSRLQGA